MPKTGPDRMASTPEPGTAKETKLKERVVVRAREGLHLLDVKPNVGKEYTPKGSLVEEVEDFVHLSQVLSVRWKMEQLRLLITKATLSGFHAKSENDTYSVIVGKE